MAGYSGTPLIQKIGVRPGHRIMVRNQPPTFFKELGPMPEGAQYSTKPSGRANVVICFSERKAELEKNFPSLADKLVPDGMLWISWPKKASGVATDLTEDVVREIGLDSGLVDVKVCAIDETWSGLKFVIRTKDRPAAVKKKQAK
ncbi:MAG: DUF3052 domain-containing protein [Actinomycetota bacterium]